MARQPNDTLLTRARRRARRRRLQLAVVTVGLVAAAAVVGVQALRHDRPHDERTEAQPMVERQHVLADELRRGELQLVRAERAQTLALRPHCAKKAVPLTIDATAPFRRARHVVTGPEVTVVLVGDSPNEERVSVITAKPSCPRGAKSPAVGRTTTMTLRRLRSTGTAATYRVAS